MEENAVAGDGTEENTIADDGTGIPEEREAEMNELEENASEDDRSEDNTTDSDGSDGDMADSGGAGGGMADSGMSGNNADSAGKLRLTYRLTRPERCEFALRLYWENRNRNRELLEIALLLVYEMTVFFYSHGQGGVARYLLGPAVLFAVVFFRCCRNGADGGTCKLAIGGGILEFDGGSILRFPCCEITGVRPGRHILILEKGERKKFAVLYAIPLRAFASAQEQERFLAALREPAEEWPVIVPESGDIQGGFQFEYDLDPERYRRVAEGFKRASEEKRSPMIWYVIGLVIFWILGPVADLLVELIGSILIVAAVWLAAYYILRYLLGKRGKEGERPGGGSVNPEILRNWKLRIDDSGVHIFRPTYYGFAEWKQYASVLETEEFFYLRQADPRLFVPIPCESFQNNEEKERFTQYCRARGLTWKFVGSGEKKKDPLKKFLEYAGLTVFLLIMAIVWSARPSVRPSETGREENAAGGGGADLAGGGDSQSGETGDAAVYHFDASAYPAYVPFDRQLEVLSSLGIVIPEREAAAYRGWMEENGEHRIYAEGYPYVEILRRVCPEQPDGELSQGASEAGEPVDEESSDREPAEGKSAAGASAGGEPPDKALSDGAPSNTDPSNAGPVYLHLEEMTSGRGYADLLGQIEKLGQGNFAFTDIGQNRLPETPQDGNCVIEVTFFCNSVPCRYVANSDSGWLDGGIVSYVNDVFADAGIPGRLYGLADGVEGMIVFYNTEKWAESFEAQTGLTFGPEEPYPGEADSSG